MAFGKAFKTIKEAREFCEKKRQRGENVEIRKMSKKLHPKRKKLFHVGTQIDFLNFA